MLFDLFCFSFNTEYFLFKNDVISVYINIHEVYVKTEGKNNTVFINKNLNCVTTVSTCGQHKHAVKINIRIKYIYI